MLIRALRQPNTSAEAAGKQPTAPFLAKPPSPPLGSSRSPRAGSKPASPLTARGPSKDSALARDDDDTPPWPPSASRHLGSFRQQQQVATPRLPPALFASEPLREKGPSPSGGQQKACLLPSALSEAETPRGKASPTTAAAGAAAGAANVAADLPRIQGARRGASKSSAGGRTGTDTAIRSITRVSVFSDTTTDERAETAEIDEEEDDDDLGSLARSWRRSQSEEQAKARQGESRRQEQDFDRESPDLDSDEQRRRRQTFELHQVAKACNCQVVDASCKDPPQISDKVAAVLVVGDCHSTSAMQHLAGHILPVVEERANKEGVALGIIAVLPSLDPFGERHAILDAQRELLANGFHDVIVQASCKADFQLAVMMGVVRAEARLEAEMELAESRALEPHDGMFWKSAHKLFKEVLPAMDEDIGAKVEPKMQVGDLRLEKVLGQGGFSQVYVATSSEERCLKAVKIVSKDLYRSLDEVGGLLREVRAMTRLQHDNLVKFHEVLHGPNHLFLCMELAGPCNLVSAVRRAGGRFGVEVARNYHRQLSDAVEYCHSRGVAHRDLKPENVAVSACGEHIKVLDFGNAVPVASQCFDLAGTMPFMAPEVLAVNDDIPYLPGKSDVWSSGVVLLELLCGLGKLNRMVGWGTSSEAGKARCKELRSFLREEHALRDALSAELGHIEEDLLALLRGMLQVSVDRRLSAADVVCSSWLRAESGTGSRDPLPQLPDA